MSAHVAFGSNQTSDDFRIMYALSPKAGIQQIDCDVRIGPIEDINDAHANVLVPANLKRYFVMQS
jgi:hypothetical protein